MNLAKYLSTKRIPQSDFAEKIGVTQVAVSRYVTGLRTPSLAVALKIEKATKGAVKPKDWASSPQQEAV